ncbi:FMN-binding negative transcriptional regulator [Sediminibacterium goheungense]|uniref:PaiB family negative transcriptional regulator n=1 Tax=Sediminibacterium goheungense TaxID=1086393 RepID=A0A4R6IWG7_9BACT|nr:FMN-binding negative transcriptional regulator [Sediminibacterium goheungense]TDO27053.1 PaiB family negative transcriptional regulator [Sediminibacterium goheungense]
MYHLPVYQEKDQQKIIAFIQQYPFATLTGVSPQQQPVATQIPLLVKEKNGKLFLTGHLMKQTDHHKAFLENKQALVLFHGPHTYVSASWYENKQQASTWNYMTVHVRGTVQYLPDEALPDMLDELTSHFENNPDSPSLYKELPVEYLQRLMKAIVAFEIAVESTDAIFKLSQNRDEKSFRQIIQQLEKGDFDAQRVAVEMKKIQS